MNDKIDSVIKATDESVDKYVVGKEQPEIVLNHLKRFSNYVPLGGTVLDVGCGHGRDCKYFEDKFKVVGIDLSEQMLTKARNACKKTYLMKMDIRDIGRIPWEFDGIWSCAVLHHLPREYLNKFISDLFKILSDNGILFLTFKVSNSSGMVFRKDLGVEKFYESYTRDEVTRVLEDTGFSIIDDFIEKKDYVWLNIYATN